jgi:hypothetical protein
LQRPPQTIAGNFPSNSAGVGGSGHGGSRKESQCSDNRANDGCATGGTFYTNPALEFLPRTYRFKKAAQPEEFASARLMPIHQQVGLAHLRRPETGPSCILIYGNERHVQDCVRDHCRSNVGLDERLHNSSH